MPRRTKGVRPSKFFHIPRVHVIRLVAMSRKKSAPLQTSPGLNSRSRLDRIIYFQVQVNAGKYPNCSTLSRHFGVSVKSILRDVEYLKDRQQMPIEFDPVKNGYYFTGPVSSIKGIEVTEGEVVALLVAQKALFQYRGTSFEKPLRSAVAKLVHGMRDLVTLNLVDLDAAISFRDSGAVQLDAETFSTLAKAVQHSREVTFQYHKLKSKKPEVRRVRPYNLCCSGHLWYCVAYDAERNALRNFALTRMTDVTITDTAFVRPLDFSIQEHLAGSFGIFCGDSGRDYKVRVRFDEFATRLVGERKWHESQKLSLSKNGTSELSVTLRSIEEIERWILSWGSHAKVLAPAELKARVIRVAREIVENSDFLDG